MPRYLHSDLQLIVRLLVAMVLGGALGYERESQGKSAGIRTLMLISMGCALFMVVENRGGKHAAFWPQHAL